ncbi:type II toxin-antitoxin system RelE/ParE family toxin [Lactobacillus paragasseri]|uniref:Type II toxin-antitoxin system RelE/ParE family toxin n=1 Tax=Lactobacillus paragasseri TaxID=2107999 RepID=A0AAW6XQB0_9LACO|nr:type II toxin-antitoxin system RelE/ParE family toxin [Lactobacillus paragasseri]MDK6869269.1 type II toxin-antitoxin system RelE/ParE family toxin [Lactobacillus paragasseri]TVU99044.1 type II toxin-antitoxin system RelE/ParE family toxin [Lactobacillus paragasseri]
MFSLELSTPAKEYFENLKQYLLINFGETVQRESLTKEEQKLENLKSFPYIGIKASKFSELLDGYYVLLDKNEYIFYQVDEKEKTIYIELVLSTKEDLIVDCKIKLNTLEK